LAVSWSNEDDSEGEVEISKSAKHDTALTSRVMYDMKSFYEELTYEELAASSICSSMGFATPTPTEPQKNMPAANVSTSAASTPA
jgi:hypothetical protein